MAKSRKLKEVNHDAEEDARWKRFLREAKGDLGAMRKLLNARAEKGRCTRAAKVYDHLLLQLMSLYVSPAALERYRQGFTESEINAISERGDDLVAGVVCAENSMMAALKRMVEPHSMYAQAAYGDFVESLYARWQFVELSNGEGIEALSADGVNVARD